MSAPTNTFLPTPVSVQLPAVDIVTGPSEPGKEQEIYNLSYFLAAMQTAIANSTSWAAFQTAMAALPPTP
ncbi:MAG: hypothetical protein WAK31_02015 [Chthoniobacterales bacterium]